MLDVMCKLRAQSFTSLMSDLHQDINRVSSLMSTWVPSALMENFLERIAFLRHWFINQNEESNKYKYSLLSYITKALTEHFLQGFKINFKLGSKINQG